jgi:hypothetical protein
MSLTDWVTLAFNDRLVPKRRKTKTRVSLQAELAEQRCLLSGTSMIHYGEAFDGGGGGKTGSGGGEFMNPLDSIPQLNSRLGAPVSVYLDFDGHTETQDWPGVRNDGQQGQPVVTPVFDIDNDFTTFSDEELRMIEEVWYRTAEDFSPFNVNVTTVDPGSYNNFETILVSIGGNGSWLGNAGGVAFLNSFNNSLVNTVYVFSDNVGLGGVVHTKGLALTSSHEAGHALGLQHHSVYDAGGNKTAEYDPGRPDLGPIMGAPYQSVRDTWSSAPDTTGSNNIQSDLTLMTRAANQTFAFRQDDHGNTFGTATEIVVTSPDVSASGVIEITDDIDMFSVETNSGRISFSVEGLDVNDVFGITGRTPGTNLDLVMRLYDSDGVLLATSDPATSLNASITLDVQAGTYYIAISNTGEYGALGQYDLTGTVIPLPKVPTMIAPSGTLDQPVPVFEWTSAAGAASYDLAVDNLTTGQSSFYTQNVTTTIHQAVNQFPQGEFQARVRTVAADGSTSEWSEYLTFQIDIPAPPKPLITRPVGDVATSFPTFVWESVPNASEYALWVNDFNTGRRVIYRTNFDGLDYTHFDPLVDGTYRAWVRATNSVGEDSPWSDFVEFTIDLPTPTATKITAPATPTTNVNPRIVWDAVPGAYRYDLWVDYRDGGVNQYIRNENITGQNWYDPATLPQGNYVAWVRAANANGEVAPWSPAYSFNVDILPPGTPTLTGPTGPGGSLTITTANPTFTWTEVDRAHTYDLWVNNQTTGELQIIREKALTTNSYTSVSNLPQGDYRAWVRGINSASEVGAWSPAYSFTIDDPIPSVPVITGPQPNPGGAVETDTPTITWSADVTGQSYDLWIDNNSLGVTQYRRKTDVIGESYTIPYEERLPEHIFTIWVRSENGSGEFSDWSEPFQMRIDVPNPTTPTIVSPGGTIFDTTPIFEWTHARGSVQYEILVRDLDRQENIVLNVRNFKVNPDGTIASYETPESQAFRKGTYRFWIRAFNSQGVSSSWSASRSFVIAANDLSPAADLFSDAAEVVVASAGSVDRFEWTEVPAATTTALPTAVEASADVVAPEVTTAAMSDADLHEKVMMELADPAPAVAASEQHGEGTVDAVSVAAGLGLLPMTMRRADRRRKAN